MNIDLPQRRGGSENTFVKFWFKNLLNPEWAIISIFRGMNYKNISGHTKGLKCGFAGSEVSI